MHPVTHTIAAAVSGKSWTKASGHTIMWHTNTIVFLSFFYCCRGWRGWSKARIIFCKKIRMEKCCNKSFDETVWNENLLDTKKKQGTLFIYSFCRDPFILPVLCLLCEDFLTFPHHAPKLEQPVLRGLHPMDEFWEDCLPVGGTAQQSR